MRTTFRAAFLAMAAAVTLAMPVEAQRPARQPEQPGQPERAVAAEPEQERPANRHFRPVFRLGQNYTLRADEEVNNVVVVFGDVTIEGRVRDDVVVTFGSVRLASTARIDGAFVAVGGNVIADQGATVRREVVVVGGSLMSATDHLSEWGEQVIVGTPALGRTLEGFVPWVTRGLLWGRLIVPGIWWMWWAVGIFFLVYLAINTALDRPVRASADVLGARPLSSFMLGLLVLLLTVPVLAILAATVIGVAVVPFVLCAIVAAGLIGKVAVMRSIGLAFIRPAEPEGRTLAFAAFLLGFAVLTLAYMVPVVGIVTWGLTSVFGLGAAAIAFRTSLRRERPPAPVAPAPPVPPAPEGVAPAVVAAPEGAVMASEPIAHVASAPAFEASAVGSEPIAPPPLRAAEGLAQYPRATFLDRVAAFALDCILVAIVNGMLLDLNRYDGMFPFLLLVYHVAFWAWRGTTLGGIIVGLRVVRTSGGELRPVDSIVRGLTGIFSIVALGIGCLWMLQDPEKQMWHDKIAGTIVVKLPRDLVLA